LWLAYLELDRTQWLSPEEIQRKQLDQVRLLLTHCVAHVPYYRQVLSGAGIDPGAIQSLDDFRRIPLLSRRTYQEKTESFVATRLPQGTLATSIIHTSGSSGSPTRVYKTNVVHLWWCAYWLRDLEWCGIDPTLSLAAIRSSGPTVDRTPELLQGVSVPYWLHELQPLIKTGSSHFMEIRQDHRRQLQWLRQLAPDYLLSYPPNLEVLANLELREQAPARSIPSLRAIRAISDTLTEEAQSTIESAFGVPVFNTYSCAETGYLATTCPERHGLHVHAENVILEVLDESGQPCGPGQTGEVFLTSLTNFRAPLIRYGVGDVATVGPERCACGRGLPVLARVQGKNSPLFRLPDGRPKSSALLAFLVRKVGGHWQHQVIQKALDHVVVRLVSDGTWTDQHAGKLREKVQEFFEGPIHIDIEIRDRLPLPPSGKFQSMIVELESAGGNP